jgi:excisionase family DNA binding protein
MDCMEDLTSRVKPDRVTVSVTEAAHMLGIGRTLAYEAARDGSLRTIRVGRRVLVPMLAIEELLSQASSGRATPS